MGYARKIFLLRLSPARVRGSAPDGIARRPERQFPLKRGTSRQLCSEAFGLGPVRRPFGLRRGRAEPAPQMEDLQWKNFC